MKCLPQSACVDWGKGNWSLEGKFAEMGKLSIYIYENVFKLRVLEMGEIPL